MIILRAFFVWSLIALLFQGVSYAQSLADQGLCTNLTPKQQQTIDGILSVTKKSDTIAARLVDGDAGASALISRMLNSWSDQLGYECNFRRLRRSVDTMIQRIFTIKQQYEEFKNLASSPEAEAAMIQLQQHIMGLVSHVDLSVYSKPLNLYSTTTITVDANIPTMGKGTMSVTVGTKGQFDIQNNDFDSTIKADVVMSLQNFVNKTNISLKALGDIDVTMLDDLYVRINSLSLDGSSTDKSIQQSIAMYNVMMKQATDLLSDKSINMTSSQDVGYSQPVDVVSSLGSALVQQSLVYDAMDMMNTTSMMKFYSDSGNIPNVYYAYMNPVMCDVIVDKSMKLSCLASITEDLYRQHTSIMLVLGSGGVDHMISVDPASIMSFDGSVIQRNQKFISNIIIPLDEKGNKLTYKNEQLAVSIKDESMTLSIQGMLNNKGSNIKGSFSSADGYKGTMNLQTSSSKKNITTYNQLYNFGMDVYQDAVQLINLNITGSQTIDTSNTTGIKKPSSSITVEQAMKLLETTLGGLMGQ